MAGVTTGSGEPTIGESLRYARAKAKLTRQELSARTKIATNTIWRYETDRTSPNTETMDRLARALGTTSSALLAGERSDGTEEIASRGVQNARDNEAVETNLSDRLRQNAIALLRRAHRDPSPEKMARDLLREVGWIGFVHTWGRLKDKPELTLQEADGVAQSVIAGTSGGFGLHDQDFGGLEYSMARQLDRTGPSELALRLASAVLESEDAEETERELAERIVARAAEWAEKYRPPYRKPYFP